jgi:hypothetical protein
VTPPLPWYARAILLRPRAVLARLEQAVAAGVSPVAPNSWQLSLGVLRMWHRLLRRTETVGTSASPVRSTWRARLLRPRGLRLPFLLAERAVAPLDLTGLASPTERLLRHLLAAHHEGPQLVYDLEILAAHPGGLAGLRERVGRLLAEDTRRHRWLRDLTVFEGYHEGLAAAVDRALAGEPLPAELADDPDVSFAAAMRWCARQPPDPASTLAAWRAGRFSLPHGIAEVER